VSSQICVKDAEPKGEDVHVWSYRTDHTDNEGGTERKDLHAAE
jgi:hypothetical protein